VVNPDIIRHRASTVCRWDNRLLTVRATDPVSGRDYLFLPGGGIEPGESPAQAAVRETLEETGHAVRLIGQPIIAEYSFDWTAKCYRCHTHFFAAELVDPGSPPREILRDDPSLHGTEWIDVQRIEEVFAYHAVIGDAVRKLVGKDPGPPGRR
jgi:8-oxo-dGTP pyrophosphatase MutT (NUDIX family)